MTIKSSAQDLADGHQQDDPRSHQPNVALTVGELVVGARVVPAESLREALTRKQKGYAPSYADLKGIAPAPSIPGGMPPGWLVEEFIADLAIDCKVGYVAVKQDDEGLRRVFRERSGPISAAIAITFDAPPGAAGD